LSPDTCGPQTAPGSSTAHSARAHTALLRLCCRTYVSTLCYCFRDMLSACSRRVQMTNFSLHRPLQLMSFISFVSQEFLSEFQELIRIPSDLIPNVAYITAGREVVLGQWQLRVCVLTHIIFRNENCLRRAKISVCYCPLD
jgi:hypothetical protein